MFRKPRWSVTWPVRPSGTYSVYARATDPTDAVRAAAERDMATADGYTIAFDYEPEVWRLQHPYRMRSHHVAGPEFPDETPGEVAFTPEPLDLDAIATEVVSVIRVCDAHEHCKDVARAAVGQIVGNLLPTQTEAVLAIVTAETREINAYTGGWA